MGVIVFNPLDKPIDFGLETDDYRSCRKVWKDEGNYDELSRVMRAVAVVDLRMVDITDFTVVYLDTDVYPCGTLEELFLGNREKKPILLWCPQGKKAIPDWLFGRLPHQMFFETEEELLGYLHHVHTAPKVETYRRWMFFDPTRVYKPHVLRMIAAASGSGY